MTTKGFDQGKVNYVRLAPFFGGVSLVAVVLSFVLLGVKGLNYGIDFAGGTEVQVKFASEVKAEDVRSFMKEAGIENAHVQGFGGGSNEFMLRFETAKGATDKETNENQSKQISVVTDGLKAKFAQASPDIRRVDSVGPQVGSQLKKDSLLAVFYSLLLILIYVGLRFDYEFAPGAVICLFHDAVLVVGAFCLLGKEINVQILAAVLTVIAYSLNDTIINYDRIRENLILFKGVDLKAIVNRSTNETMVRTILTSTTVIIAVLSLYFFAGGVISDFALAMFIGVIAGTYSSIYVAAPLTLVFNKLRKA